jgi:uncharacterized protein (TIGR02391 family)
MLAQVEISQALSDAIAENYDKGNYTGAIIDAIMHLCSTIRDRSGLQSDGVALMNEAFGGQDPLLKLNSLRTDTDKNVQKGIESIMRGIVQAIRNPRSHEKHTDPKPEADAILTFVDYLLTLVNRSKAPFDIETFLARVKDKDFLETEENAELMVAEVPKEKLLETLFTSYEHRQQIKPNIMKLLVLSIFKHIEAEQQKTFVARVSEDLRSSDDVPTIMAATSIFAGENWTRIDRVSRLRIENKLVKSVREGEYLSDSAKCKNGALGTWITNIYSLIELKDQLRYSLIRKLTSSNKAEQDYVFQFFSAVLLEYGSTPSHGLLNVIKNGLQLGDKRFYDLVQPAFVFEEPEWAQGDIKKLFDSFEEKKTERNVSLFEDDIPF